MTDSNINYKERTIFQLNQLKESLEFHEDCMKYCKTQKQFDRHREIVSELTYDIAELEELIKEL